MAWFNAERLFCKQLLSEAVFWSVLNRSTLWKGHGQSKGSLKFTSCSCSSCQRNPGRTREPAPEHLCHTARGPLPRGCCQGDTPHLCKRWPCRSRVVPHSEHTATPGEHQGLGEPLGANGTVPLLTGGTWAQPLCFCPHLDLHSVTFVTLSYPRLSQLVISGDLSFMYQVQNVESKQMSFW